MEQIKGQAQVPTPPSPEDPCLEQPARLLEWDSAFFGKRIATVSIPQPDRESVARLLSWCDSQQVDCLYFLVAAEDIEMTRFAEDNGFRLTDIRMTLGRSLPADIVEGAGIRMARPSDHSPMKRLAAKSFTDSRFFHDEHFSNVKCEELYSTWLERSCDGYADRVFIAECSGLPAGFITCSLGAAEGVIGLLAVDGDFQSRGIGRALVTAALNYFREQGMTRARVVTQGSNLRSQRLYQRCGFVTEQVQLWYHRWFTLHKATAANPQRGTGLT